MRHFLAVLALATGISSQPAVDRHLIVSSAVLEDRSGTLTIGDVSTRDFVPTNPSLSKGYTASAFWLRLRVRAPADGGAVVLRVPQTYLDEVRLFEPDAAHPASWKTRATGDRYAFAARDFPAIALFFIVTVPPPESTYYLRVQTTGTMTMSVEALDFREAYIRERQLDLMQAVVVGLLAWLLVIGFRDYLATREAVSGLFALYQAVYIAYELSATGYLVPLAPSGFPQLADWTQSILICGAAFTYTLFSRSLFRLYSPPRPWIQGLNLLLLVFPVLLAAMALGHVRLALATNMVLLIVERWYFVGVAFAARQEQVPSRRALRTVYVVAGVTVSVFVFPTLGFRPVSESHLAGALGLFIAGVINSSLFIALLHARAGQSRREAAQKAQELALAQHTLDIERALKTQAENEARTDYLTGLWNRRQFVSRAEDEVARATRYKAPLSLLMIDVDHFKAVNDARGHAVGDEVLKAVSSLIRGALRDVDLVGRVGGEEFAAVLLETEGAPAMQVAQRIREVVAGTPFVPDDGGGVTVTISIGMTELAGREVSLDRLLTEADAALYDAKALGRNRVASKRP